MDEKITHGTYEEKKLKFKHFKAFVIILLIILLVILILCIRSCSMGNKEKNLLN